VTVVRTRAHDIPAAAWSRRIGEPLALPVRPRVDAPMIDDGPTGGVPIGGIGSGSIGRTCDGDFARWHLRVGSHRFARVPACQFSVFVGSPSGATEAHVLSTMRPGELEAWNWGLSAGAGTYHGLFPRAWVDYDRAGLPIGLVQRQLSPVLPHNYRESSFPVGLFAWSVENPTAEPLRVGLMFTWQALDEGAEGTPAGAIGRLVRDAEVAGAVLENGREGGSPLGQFAIVACEEDDARASIRSRFAVADAAAVWQDFARDGALDDLDDPRPAGAGEAIGAAVALTTIVPPGESRVLRFALAWDFPLMRFGSGRTWYRRYTRFFGRGGTNAFRIAADGLRHEHEWERAIEEWQRPYLEDRTRPPAYAMALFNELYILVDGGTAWEDGLVGGPAPAEDAGRFAILECFDYPFYNTHDVLFYASWALAQLWPRLETSTLRSMSDTVAAIDPRTVTIHATGARATRKVAGAIAHDIGSPSDDPWHVSNSYHFQDPNRWKDLNSKFVLQLWRDVAHLDAGDLIAHAWPSAKAALERLVAADADGDALPDHEGADQTFDTWPMAGPSAYTGGLWVSALAAAERLALASGDEAARVRYAALRERATRSLRARLWNGRYLRYDGSRGPSSNSIMADQLCGLWWADATGLPPYLDAAEARTALETIVRFNVRGFASGQLGAVNGMRPDGSVDASSEQSQEVWPGVTYVLAALLLARGLDDAAWETALGAVRGTYERGLWFRTPEAYDEAGNFRASLYMRPLAIWAIEHALRMRGRGLPA
jgi:non-lysosomal glucosylceramidase